MLRRLAAALAALVLAPASASAAFPQDPPNDPDFDAAERNCATTSVNAEQHYLYSAMSRCTPNARDPENAAGMSVDRAWREYGAGRPDTTIAYVEGGINWFAADVEDIVDRVYINRGELPAPTTDNGDGQLDRRDYADSRDANGNGLVDPEDLIVRFSDGEDSDGNGYVDDISGWDFYHDQNDPATYDAEYLHANNQIRQAAAEADNGFRGAGVCPRCTIIPVKAGAEALDRTDDLAEAWLFAADAGADVIVSVTADLGYSHFMRQAVDAIWKRGVVMVAASNDFDSTDHQGGMFHPHVVPGNGLTPNANGVEGPAANALTTTFRARSGQTSWGTKNFTSVSTRGGSTSTSTPTHGGIFGLVLSAGLDAGRPLTNGEVLQVVRATASDVNDPESNWPSRPGWDLQFGYGRPNAHRAMKAVHDGDVPPVGWIDSPDWYALFDPSVEPKVTVRGHVEARRSRAYRWALEYAPGAEPADGDFLPGGSGGGAKAFDGELGTLDLAKVPRSFWTKAFALSKTKTLETNEHYTVTLRLRVTDAEGRVGEERRSIAVHRDETALRGFPRRFGKPGTGGEAQPQLADLQGTGRLAAIFGDADGVVHAIDGATGEELPGWPVRTEPTRVTRRHDGIEPGHEPIVSTAAVGDLDGDGRLSVVATSTTGRTYVWNARGRRRRGWPRALDAGVVKPAIPRRREEFARLPIQGAFAPPVLVDLDGDERLDVVQAAWDGRLHAFDAAGRELPGWPVEVTVPPSLPPAQGFKRLNDHKLDTPPAVADLDGDGKPELVVRSQYFDILGEGIQPLGRGHIHAYRADGKPVAGFPRKQQALVVYYGSAQEFITEGSNAPVAADVDGDGDDEIAVAQIFSATALIDGDGRDIRTFAPVPDATLGVFADPARLLTGGGLPADVPVSFTTSGAFGRFGEDRALVYAEPGSGALSVAGALLTTGSGLPIKNSLRAFSARSGAALPGFPADTQGLDFIGAPTIADVTGDGAPELLQAGDSSALHAFAARGRQAAGFPKFQTGWALYGPAAGDLDADGRTDVVLATREGYLMAWRTQGRAARGNEEWWAYRHDERNTARYGADTRPPGAARDLALSRDRRSIQFTAPGADWYAGRAARFLVDLEAGTRRRALAARAPGDAGTAVSVALPLRARRVTVRAVDAAGNVGPPRTTVRRCVSRRSFSIKLEKVPRRLGRVVRARVFVNGKRVRVVRGRRLRARVDLRGLPRGTFRVRIVQRTSRGRTVRSTRRYRTCAPRPVQARARPRKVGR